MSISDEDRKSVDAMMSLDRMNNDNEKLDIDAIDTQGEVCKGSKGWDH